MKPNPLKWIIAEDSLESRQGHWFEYLLGFERGLTKLGDQVTWLVSHRATSEILSSFGALPLLPESAFRKVSETRSLWRRYLRIPVHAWHTFFALKKYLTANPGADIIFVPTVIVHHLLGWFFLVKGVLSQSQTHLLLFFPNLPIRLNETGPALDGSPTAHLTKLLLRGMKSEIKNGTVILGVETHAMQKAAESVFGVPFTYFPHPVQPIELAGHPSDLITMACYGPARYEKGSDLLVSAIERYLVRFPESKVQFVVQWMDDFSLRDGSTAKFPSSLRNHPKVEIITRFFTEGEYEDRLAKTDLLLLPYRSSSYGLRVSRVVIEALVNGKPAIVTANTTMAQQLKEYGSGLTCADEQVESLINAIAEAVLGLDAIAKAAQERQRSAVEHFSVEHFRNSLGKR